MCCFNSMRGVYNSNVHHAPFCRRLGFGRKRAYLRGTKKFRKNLWNCIRAFLLGWRCGEVAAFERVESGLVTLLLLQAETTAGTKAR